MCILSVQLTVAATKPVRKVYLGKKASSRKPVKEPKAILEIFKDLPSDDLDFIKQLDKQFQKFGNNVKIKVEKENTTTSKNSKRTIDGSLGYVMLT